MTSTEQATSLVDLLDQLVEVPPPPLVSMFPQTWGWAVLGMLLLGGLCWTGLIIIRRYQANAYRRAALEELREAGDDTAKVAEILRRSALTAYSRQTICRLSGKEWLMFLEASAKGLNFTSGPGTSLVTAPYRDSGQTPGIGQLAAQWIRKHQATEP